MKTRRFLQTPLAVTASVLLLLTLCACGAKGDRVGELSTTAPLSKEIAPAAVESGAQAVTYVILNDENTTINGEGAAFENGELFIRAPGSYQLKGALSDGKIIVTADCAAGPVTLCLNGVALACGDGAPLQILGVQTQTRLVLSDESENRLRGEKADAVLFSAGNLEVDGDGTLAVFAPDGAGVCCQTLQLSSGSVSVSAREAALAAKRVILGKNGRLVSCGKRVTQAVSGGAALTLQGDFDRETAVRILTDDGDPVTVVTPEVDCETILLAGGALVSGECYCVETKGERMASVTAD